ncbi:MAG: exopolysaccharide biosynthesis polyprenyl glycosylphosphotransferase [Opitutaceae bacterium]|nr:exopolysaccharide biosynthesis polyprenyl glycosylphosphotransferase [Opitutaceae bacterium]
MTEPPNISGTLQRNSSPSAAAGSGSPVVADATATSSPASGPANFSRIRKVILPAWLVIGDTVMAFAALALAYWLRYESPLRQLALIDVPDAHFLAYIPLLSLGVAFLIAGFAQLNLYEERLLLRKYQSFALIIKGTTIWLAAYLALALVIKFDPPISRLFVPMGYVSVLLVMFAWRSGFYALLVRPAWRERLRQRVAVLGWNEEAQSLVAELRAQPAHPYSFCGAITLPGDSLPPEAIGTLDTLADTLARHQIDVLIAARTDLSRDQLLRVVQVCERTYVEWKVIPNSFQILLSGLRLQTIGRLPVLGIEDLAINQLFNRVLKRLVDIVGSLIGLVLALPAMALLALLIKRESPTGPVFFGQRRIGASHRPFTLWKLRSMVPDAAAQDAQRQSTERQDKRLLRIGAFMRRWNLDELPQFWNVLCGAMSLVGPRPERPFHVDRLADEIPHYIPRHLAKPGMSGWAQVNGLRGDTSIAQRIQHDIYYIENWSLWLDVQILLLTFVRWKNAY